MTKMEQRKTRACKEEEKRRSARSLVNRKSEGARDGDVMNQLGKKGKVFSLPFLASATLPFAFNSSEATNQNQTNLAYFYQLFFS